LTGIQRPSWEEYFLELARLASTRATCPVRQVGAVFVDPVTQVVLATGFNGSPRGTPHCGNACYERKHGDRTSECRAIHAEMNGLLSAARTSTALNESFVYCTLNPCVNCARALIQANIRRVVYSEEFSYFGAIQELNDAGVETIHYKKQ